MSNSQAPLRILTISANELILELIQTALERDEHYFGLDGVAHQDDLLETIARSAPDFVLLDFLAPNLQLVEMLDKISLQFPEVVTIVILPEDQVAEAHRVLMAGARAFIIQPFNQNQFLTVLERLAELHQRNLKSKSDAALQVEYAAAHRGTIVVFSPKGGVGCSSVAINLAAALMNELKQEVLLLDGKLLFGDLDIMLNLKTQNSIADLIPHVGALDEGLIRDVVSVHVSGLKVLPAPANPSAAHGIRPEDLHRALIGLQTVFPYVVIDSGNFLSDNAVTFMDACHKIILVVNPDIACLRDASRFFEICRTTLSFPKDKVLVVVNQHDQRDGLSLKDIERALQVKVFATFPWDRRTSLQSINRGVPVMLQAQNSPLRKASMDFATNLIAALGHVPNEAAKTRKVLSDVLSKSSRLG